MGGLDDELELNAVDAEDLEEALPDLLSFLDLALEGFFEFELDSFEGFEEKLFTFIFILAGWLV